MPGSHSRPVPFRGFVLICGYGVTESQTKENERREDARRIRGKSPDLKLSAYADLVKIPQLM